VSLRFPLLQEMRRSAKSCAFGAAEPTGSNSTANTRQTSRQAAGGTRQTTPAGHWATYLSIVGVTRSKLLAKRHLRLALHRLDLDVRRVSSRPYGEEPWLDIDRLAAAWATPITTIFDVGANVGETSLTLHKRFPHARVLAFEPHPATYERLCENVEGEGNSGPLVPSLRRRRRPLGDVPRLDGSSDDPCAPASFLTSGTWNILHPTIRCLIQATHGDRRDAPGSLLMPVTLRGGTGRGPRPRTAAIRGGY
jgi:hypothetical protein